MNNVRTLLVAALLAGAVVAPSAQAATHCYDKVVYRKHAVQDPHRVTGTAIGAALGGLIGHQVGGGKGRDLATVGGAVAGGVAGHKIQRHRQDRTYREIVRVCN
ncbi:glycine zipper 2TM domain-containing protein [Cognatilysobacter lacus]|uniref:Glycine zipper 2TM domain-containing protein n=1 Tax=Cognatilysobacter lacus TaxID=1643323 RepID=A0A5D8Z950_9GAMM|nr:glycine zipper 2TM domain-containing protein [Lysobacter lacus]TZF91428.1 glycine zipper 2TM domain-containing protein [Lysobacter lacus]